MHFTYNRLVHNPADDSDPLLCLQLQDGSKDAFMAIFERYRKRVFVEILQWISDEKEAGNLTEQVFIWLWENKKSIKNTSHLGCFLINDVLPKFVKSTNSTR